MILIITFSTICIQIHYDFTSDFDNLFRMKLDVEHELSGYLITLFYPYRDDETSYIL